MKRMMIAVAVMSLMSACAGNKMWVKQGATQEEFYQQKTDCQKIAGAIAGDNPLILGTAFKDCMRERGYQYTTVGQ